MTSRLLRLLSVFVFTAAVVSPVAASAAEDGTPVSGCSFPLPVGAENVVEQRWKVPPIASLPSPSRVTMCKYDFDGVAYTLIVGQYAKETVAKAAIRSLYRGDRMMYLGIPSTFVAASKKTSSGLTPIAGRVSSDDCGRFDDEVFDTGCPQGRAAAVRSGSAIWVLSNRFELELGQLRSAPTKALSALLATQTVPVSPR